VAGCFVAFAADDAIAPAWAAAALPPLTATVVGRTNGPYRAGLLALRAGPALEQAVNALPERPGVLIVDATGRDHPRRAGLAVHLGQVLDLPTVGVTHRTLLARGEPPAARRGAHTPLTLDGEHVGAWLRIQPRARPIAVHAAWRTDPATAVEVILHVAGRVRTPEPLREARRLARLARARSPSSPRQ
jgi:deoxyribonuclease V